ncbi:MAG: ABC transporter permease [Chloroflexales bacterium]|nr:ABC transporter permease [Chloroflexales bacterium]
MAVSIPSTPTRKRRTPNALLLLMPATLIVVVFFLLPLFILLRYSFNQFVPGELMRSAFTLENYVNFAGDPFYRNVLWTTIGMALICTLLSLVLAFPVAYVLARMTSRFKGLLIMLVVFPLLVGNEVRAAGWIALLGNQGFLNSTLVALGLIDSPIKIMYTPRAVAIGILAVVLPYMILTLQSVLEGIDTSLQEAALNLGASPWTTFRTITLPLAIPGVVAGTSLVFILCMNAYATPVLLGGPRFQMMAPSVYRQIAGVSNWPFGAAMAFVLMATTLALTVFSAVMLQRRYRG